MQGVAALPREARPGGEPLDPSPLEASAGVATTDEALVARAQTGDHDAFGQLVQRWQHRMFALALREVQDETEAHEIVQEAFVSAWRSIGKFRRDSRFSTWMYRITLNRCRDWRRSRKRARMVSLDGGDAETSDAVRLADQRASLATEPAEETMARRFQLETVKRAMRSLPEAQRQAIILKEFEGLTLQEIADATGKPLSTIKTRVYQGLTTLRRLLADPVGLAAMQGGGAGRAYPRLVLQRGGESDG
ncbi:MAG: sigma-70 family RNA polymerase sigma factor [Acidobacteria bacterium]|nr:sigma-70 family RNA polymerase sigma factor [Acidobacteriota bacterium]MYJ03821.1 sigma-70 family RNA polymerase sigma factor [Acidobacteriota bacterium]